MRRWSAFALLLVVLPLLGTTGPCVPIEPVCPVGTHVDPATGACTDVCRAAADCGAGWTCQPEYPWNCAAGAACPWRCIPLGGECWTDYDCERLDPCDCADGSPWSEWECVDFRCHPRPAPSCDDGNACTLDMMDLAVGCVYVAVANGTLCDDGDVCTLGDRCVQGVCTPVSAGPCD